MNRLYDFIFKPWRAIPRWIERARRELRDDDWKPPDLAVLEFPTGARAFISLPGNEALVERLLAGGIGAVEIGRTCDTQELERMMKGETDEC